jgi:putative acyl-CoA dehydrogenase
VPSFDRAPVDAKEAAYMRLLTPAIKYWVCKSAPGFLYEAMECLGGNGYVEEGILARHYRESPVNAIWEGSGNVMCSTSSVRCRASRKRHPASCMN